MRQVIDTTSIGGQPFAVVADPGSGVLYVSDWSADAVYRLDPHTLARTGTVKVGRSPAGLVLDAQGRRLYSADRESNAVSIIDLASFSRLASVAVGQAPYAFDTGNDPRFIAVANVRCGDVSLIDKTDHTVSSLPAGKMPYGLAVIPGTGRILVANQQSGTVSLLDPQAGRQAGSLRLGGSPESVVISPDGRQAYVSEWFDDAVAVIDLEGLAMRARIKVGRGPRTMALVP
nr:YncE family protein [Xanthobacter oligotrophicus]